MHQVLVDAYTCLGAQDVTNVGSSLGSQFAQFACQPVVDRLPSETSLNPFQGMLLMKGEERTTNAPLLFCCMMTEGQHRIDPPKGIP